MRRIHFSMYVGLVCLLCAAAARPQQAAQTAAEPDAPKASQQQAALAPASATIVPRLVKFSGELKDHVGRPMTGLAGVTFAIYKDQEGGAPLWLETQNIQPDVQGRFTVLLGATKNDGVPLDLFASGEARWLGVEMPTGEQQPRVMLLSVPYALKAADAETLGGQPLSAFARVDNAESGRSTSDAPPASRSEGPPPPGPLSGLGTPGFLAKFTKFRVLGNSGLFESNGLFGIGTIHPSQALDVFGNIKISGNGNGLIFPDGSKQTSALISGSGGGTVTQVNSGPGLTGGPITTSGTLGLDLPFTDARYLQPNGNGSGLTNVNAATFNGMPPSAFVQTVTINNTFVGGATFGGKVGIGTLTPSAPLEVAGNARISGTGSTLTVGGNINVNGTTAGGIQDGTLQVHQGGADTAATFACMSPAPPGCKPLSIQTGATEMASIDQTGVLTAGGVNLPAAITATSAVSGASNSVNSTASAFNSSTNAAESFTYSVAAEPTGNNSASPSANYAWIFSTSTHPAQLTGAAIDAAGHVISNGHIDSATGITTSLPANCMAGQVPVFNLVWGCGTVGGGGGSISGVLAGTGLTGGGTSGTVTLNLNTAFTDARYAQLGSPNIFNANQTIVGDVTALSFSGNGAGLGNVNAATLGGTSASSFANLAAPNNFLGDQTFTGNVKVAGVGNKLTVGGPAIFNMDVAGEASVAANCLPIATASCTGFMFNGMTGNTILNAQVNGTQMLMADDKGDMTLGGNLTAAGATMPALGTATAASGFKSNLLSLSGSSSDGATAQDQQFSLQVFPTGNGAAGNSGALHLLFGQGGATPVDTGFSVDHAGIVTFAPGQTFSGVSGTGTVTNVGTGLGLLGGPITTSGIIAINPAVVPQLNAANNLFLGNITTAGGNISAATFTSTLLGGPNNFAGTVTAAQLNSTGPGVNTFAGPVTALSFAGDGSKLTNVIPGPGSGSYIQNGIVQQAAANFNISGSGTFGGNIALPNTLAGGSVGVFTVGGVQFLHSFGSQNTFVGAGAGNTNLTGGLNAAVGTFALKNDTTGSNNAAFGALALTFNTTGGFNSAVGAGALNLNTVGADNSAFGAAALQANTMGSSNSAFGYQALLSNTTGNFNAAFGKSALLPNTTGAFNAAFGTSALFSNSTGSGNSAFGYNVLSSNTTGMFNSAFGHNALSSNVSLTPNSAFGYNALAANTSGANNSAFGVQALQSNMTAAGNSAFGFNALAAETATSGNSAFGSNALANSTATTANSAFGYNALAANTVGGLNSAFGDDALLANTTGALNSAFGESALSANTTALGNSAFGAFALQVNTTGGDNSAFGSSALTANTLGANNSAFGADALSNNLTGNLNSAFGDAALSANTIGTDNAAFGGQALSFNTSGSDNSAFGISALFSNTTGVQNAAFGWKALLNNTTGMNNDAFGVSALSSNTTGNGNSAFGDISMVVNSTGNNNSAFGNSALHSDDTGDNNCAFGQLALTNARASSNNVAVGGDALGTLTSGDNNIALGGGAGAILTTGRDNIYIGSPGSGNESFIIRIGGTGKQTKTFIDGINGGIVNSLSGTAVFVDSSGQLGTVMSSRRYKHDIADMAGDSDLLMKLRPVSFLYKPELDDMQTRQYGLVAEEVALVAPQLVVFDKAGVPQSVRYHFVNAMLLNEVQKQRQLVEEQQRANEEQRRSIERQQGTIAQQQAEIQGLAARLAKLEALLATGK